jgi:hypothetical protein
MEGERENENGNETIAVSRPTSCRAEARRRRMDLPPVFSPLAAAKSPAIQPIRAKKNKILHPPNSEEGVRGLGATSTKFD